MGWKGTGDKVDFDGRVSTGVVDIASSDLFDGHDGIGSIDVAVAVDGDELGMKKLMMAEGREVDGGGLPISCGLTSADRQREFPFPLIGLGGPVIGEALQIV